MNETRGKSRRWPIIGLAAIAGIAVGVAAVYVTETRKGNALVEWKGDDCAPSIEAAGLLAPFAKGEVAAFRVATEPARLSELSFQTANGDKKSLADFEGQTVLLNLWATWCAPCRQEMPALDRLDAAHEGKDFSVVAVSIDTQDPAKPKQFLEEIGVKSLAFYGDPTTGIFTGLKNKGMAVGLPTTVLIDKKGCALGVMSGPAEWDSEDAKALIGAASGAV
ncbi:thiol:disulfide interchange protein TlpA [Kaistia terrae]|uniref:TlpA disulfide reductase family protein n=1 Tax=Kaistia terrae TaxID=537017 RepID=A0ABW0Q2H4_9HYPH|nr:TlpA disulfide reductase family protein [Kaistia terrae]MCX5579898.1 TlpA disulfide reductase family protein [Kaistia terrae]